MPGFRSEIVSVAPASDFGGGGDQGSSKLHRGRHRKACSSSLPTKGFGLLDCWLILAEYGLAPQRQAHAGVADATGLPFDGDQLDCVVPPSPTVSMPCTWQNHCRWLHLAVGNCWTTVVAHHFVANRFITGNLYPVT
jgi:hypothetical protein